MKNRRVVRAVVDYGVVAVALLQVIEPIMHGLHLPEATLTWANTGLDQRPPAWRAGARLHLGDSPSLEKPEAQGSLLS